jgi:hypothetical protein
MAASLNPDDRRFQRAFVNDRHRLVILATFWPIEAVLRALHRA